MRAPVRVGTEHVSATTGPTRVTPERRKKNRARRKQTRRLEASFDEIAVLPSVVQTKMMVRGPDDEYEREADRNGAAVAAALEGSAPEVPLEFTALGRPAAQRQTQEDEDVTHEPEGEVCWGRLAPESEHKVGVERLAPEPEHADAQIQAKAGRAGAVSRGLEADLGVARGSGHSLGWALRSRLEPRFGHDLSQVRIHNGPHAATLAQRIGARAFTLGSDVFFGGGEYRPETPRGRRLLAHELTHVVQQSSGGLGPQVQRKGAPAPAKGRAALDTALKGDDDDVRDLTQSEAWVGLDVTAKEAAQLIEQLLIGPTYNEDEQAGLKILVKERIWRRLDDTLIALEARDRFGQLFDDYHYTEYRQLLELLAENIGTRRVKALFLDKFISMLWVATHEEKAIVVLLERLEGPELADLLNEENRRAELRTAIDDSVLSKRFEEQVSEGNVETFEGLEEELEKIFKVKGAAQVGKRGVGDRRIRTKEDVKKLLHGAAIDLANELYHYQNEIEAAVKGGDADEISEINKKFEARLAQLLETKKREFKFELDWNLEFNRALDASFRRNWTEPDLDKINDLLKWIPPELLHANPDFRGLRRATTDPESPTTAGSAGPNFITLFKKLKASTTVHEVGHHIHFDAPKIFEKFQKISGWLKLTAGALKKLVKKEALPEDLGETLDQHRKADDDYAFVNHGKFNYHWARYDGPKEYWRYVAESGFVSSYSKTDPEDDFAETFEFYLVKHEKGKERAAKKFEFMHREIFVKYWLKKEKERILEEFDSTGKDLREKFKNTELRREVWEKGGFPIKTSLRKELDNLVKMSYDEAVKGKLDDKKVPLKGSTVAQKIGDRHLDMLRGIFRFGTEFRDRFDKVFTEAWARKKKFKGDLGDAYLALIDDLKQGAIKRLGPMLKKPLQRLIKNEATTPKPWPELDAVLKEFSSRLTVADTYVPYFDRYEKAREKWKLGYSLLVSLDKDKDLDDFSLKLLGTFPKGSVEHTLMETEIESQRRGLIVVFDTQRDTVIKEIEAGKKHRKGVPMEPKPLLAAYRKAITKEFKRIKAGKSKPPPKGGYPKWF